MSVRHVSLAIRANGQEHRPFKSGDLTEILYQSQ